jgi:hypothetical protein
MIRTLCLLLVIVGLLAGTLAIVTPPVEDSEPAPITYPEPWTNRPDPNPETSEPRVDPPQPPWHPRSLQRASRNLSGLEHHLDELARFRSMPFGPIRIDHVHRVTGAILERTDERRPRTVTIQPWSEETAGDPGLSFQVVAEPGQTFFDRFVVAPFPELGLPPGDYAVRVDGQPCIVPTYPADSQLMLFPKGPAETAPVSVVEHISGCFTSESRGRWYRPVGDEYVAEDGACLTRAQVEDLRRRVLASSPGPGESLGELLDHPDAYLASLGVTDEIIESHLATIRAACSGTGWKDAHGNAPELTAGMNELFDLHALKARLVDHLLQAPDESTNLLSLTIEIPGDPWIHMGTDSNGPDMVPWLVVAGEKRWSTVDRELSRTLVDLTPAEGWVREKVESRQNWRDTAWGQASTWGSLATELNEALSHTSLELVPGWAGLRGRFKPGHVATGPRSGWTLPSMDLSVTPPGVIDTLYLRPGWNDHWTWTDLLNEYERAERAAEAQPWLARWKQEAHGKIAVFLPRGGDHFGRSWAPVTAALWKEAGLEGAPDYAIALMSHPDGISPGMDMYIGKCALSEAGELLVLESNTSRGPLAGQGLAMDYPQGNAKYAVVRPGSDPEIRSR